VTPTMSRHIFGVGAIFFVFLIGFLKYYQIDGVVSDYEMSMFFTIFVMLQVWNMFNARALGFTHSAFKGITTNSGFMVILPAIIVIQFLIVQFGKTMFRTQPLLLSDWFYIIAGTSVVLWAGELYRFLQGKKQREIDIPDVCPFG
jgi:Ca2+-transporting ATPase